ncbi:K-stimulated pyrophosphate-energized sodium pump protein isoform X2 [Wolffia australiana]
MHTDSSSPRADYLAALSLEIEKKLQRALSHPSQRSGILQELFADAALEIDARAREMIQSSNGLAHGDAGQCFYDVLADHYIREPANGKRIVDLIVKLWSQSFSSHIFALIFHRWLFETPLHDAQSLLRFASALVQGAGNVFWIDIQTNTRRFFSLFRYLLEDVALVPSRVEIISLQARRDLFLLLSRFVLFYDLEDKLKHFLDSFPEYPTAILVGGPEDVFVIELTDQLQKLKVEPVLLHYLSQVKVLQGLELRMTTSTRLKACLYSFTSPGGPAYPTRAVRHAAWDALNFLYPVGRYPRHVISLLFRLLYPWYWPFSFWNFVVSVVRAVFYSVFGTFLTAWEKVRRGRPRDL